MKITFLIIFMGSVATGVGLIGSLVSAPKYGYILFTVIASDVIAIGCFARVFSLGGKWRVVILLLSAIVLYTLTDAILRFMFAARLLDVFNA